MSVITKKYSFWWDNSAPDFAFQAQLQPYADVVIIGAGFAGISTAYWVLRYAKKKKQRLRIVILDEAPHAAFKATGRMNGSVYLGSNHTAKHMSDLLGEKTAQKLYSYSNENNTLLRSIIELGVDCDPEFNGGFRMASTAREAIELDDSAELLRSWGYYPARFDHNQSQHIMIVPYMKGSLFVPGEGMFDPFAFCNKMARLLKANHVTIAYGAQVRHVETHPEHGPQVFLSNDHCITAGKVIHTTCNTPPLERLDEVLVSRREQVACTEPLSTDLDDMPLPLMPVELNNGIDSIRIHDGSIIMTGGKAGLKKDPELNVLDDAWFNTRILQHLDKTMMENFPVTNHMEISHAWTYIETSIRDGLPLMGEIPGERGHYVNIGHGRNKFGLAFLGAKNIAEKVLRVKMANPKEFSIFSPKRLTRGE